MREHWIDLASRALAPRLQGYRRLAYLDIPDHVNVGDSMIALGAMELLSHMSMQVEYIASLATFDARRVEALGPDCAIAIHGGGNLGDLWPRHQAFRERVLATFPSHTIVQLPQTIHFRDPEKKRQAAAAMGAHPRFHVLCRDMPSLLEAQSMGLDASLSPDHALCLPAFTRASPRYPVAVLKRIDKEAKSLDYQPQFPEHWAVRDWLTDPSRPGVQLLNLAKRSRIVRRLPSGMQGALWGKLLVAGARARVDWGAQLATEGQVLLTDRLHAHVLFCLAGARHAFVDNSYGKLSAVHEAWTHQYGLGTPCADWKAAIDWAKEELTRPQPVR